MWNNLWIEWQISKSLFFSYRPWIALNIKSTCTCNRAIKDLWICFHTGKSEKEKKKLLQYLDIFNNFNSIITTFYDSYHFAMNLKIIYLFFGIKSLFVSSNLSMSHIHVCISFFFFNFSFFIIYLRFYLSIKTIC